MKKQIKFDLKFCEELVEHCRQGYTIEQFAAEKGCSRTTIYNWVEKHEEFKEAHEMGKELLKKRVIKRLHDFADGNMPRTANVIAAIFLAKNLGIRDDVVDMSNDMNANKIILGYSLEKPKE